MIVTCTICKVDKERNQTNFKERYQKGVVKGVPRVWYSWYNQCRDCMRVNDRFYKRKDYDPVKQRRKRAIRKARGKDIECAKRMMAKYPEKYAARNKLRLAVYAGKIKKLACEMCGDPKTHGHHEDYSKPLDVRWLCAKHHMFVHRKAGEFKLSSLQAVEEYLLSKSKETQ